MKYEIILSEDVEKFVRGFLLGNISNKTLGKILKNMKGGVISLSYYQFICFKKVLRWWSGGDVTYYRNLKRIFGKYLEKMENWE